jgi:hypothetical protein
MNGESFPDFTGKVVTVQLGTPPASLALEQVRYERHLGKLYLVGRQMAVPERPNWADGATYYIAPEQIAYFAVFDSVNLYLARLAAFNAQATASVKTQPQRGWFGRG